MLDEHVRSLHDHVLSVGEHSQHATAAPWAAIRLALLLLGPQAIELFRSQPTLAVCAGANEDFIASLDAGIEPFLVSVAGHSRSPLEREKRFA
jgi:hypothetical protein